jgi:hypothetical protein
MLSLICSCFYPEPRNINIYTYDGKLSTAETPLLASSSAKPRVCLFLSQSP